MSVDIMPSTPAEAAAAPIETPSIPDASSPVEPIVEPVKKEEPKSTKKKYNLVVDGKNEDFELDLGNDEEVKKYLQKAKASDKRFQEASEVRKAAMEFLDQLKKNPRKVMRDANLGIDERKLAEEIMNEALQDMEKTPEQREREKLQKELEDIKSQRKTEKEDFQKREFERLQAEHERTLEIDISAALDVGGLPKTPRTVKAMAEMMMIALENGIDLSAKEIVPIVKNMTMSEFKEVVNSLGDDQLEDFLGKEVIGRLRKRNVAKAKAVVETASSVKSTGNDVKKPIDSKAAKKLTTREFFGI